MADQTPNHGYNVPQAGEQNWDEPLNENFRSFETDIEIRDASANRDDYEPAEGAKFLATDTGAVSIGDGKSWSRVASTGENPQFSSPVLTSALRLYGEGADAADGFAQITYLDERSRLSLAADGDISVDADGGGVGINRAPAVPLDVEGGNNWDLVNSEGALRLGNDEYRLKMGVATANTGDGTAGDCRIMSAGGIDRIRIGVELAPDLLELRAKSASVGANLEVDGNLQVSGQKNFVQSVDTPDGPRDIHYTAVEADTAHTETAGVAELTDGRVEIPLPEHFAWVTDPDEPVTVQVTPHARERVHPQVTERSRHRVVVADFADGPGDYEVSYQVRGTREGQDAEPVREPTGPGATGRDRSGRDAGDRPGGG